MSTPTKRDRHDGTLAVREPSAGVLLAVAVLSVFATQAACGWNRSASALPRALNDHEFWNLSITLSEPAGAFDHSENLTSNETHFVHVIRTLSATRGVYIGVGPEQNFTYIARLRPEMAFIVDIRPENRNLHLLYKALFELSTDRADFVSRLFSRERPPGLGPKTNVSDLFAAYQSVKPAPAWYEANTRLVRERLLDTHRFPLSSSDLEWLAYAFKAFYSDGPDIHYGRSRPGDPPGPSYRVLMTLADGIGRGRSYLASEEGFAVVKDLHSRNLIVPVVGDFAGPNTLRRVGDYAREHKAIVNAFYGSNVEVYLTRERRRAFCLNLGTLPYTSRTWFIGSKGMQRFTSKLTSCGLAPVEP